MSDVSELKQVIEDQLLVISALTAEMTANDQALDRIELALDRIGVGLDRIEAVARERMAELEKYRTQERARS